MKTSFIIVDGLDGCGKGTQLKLLKERASRENQEFVFTREPGGAPLSEKLRELFKSDLGMQSSALTQSLMMWASRRNYLEEVVWPALDKNVSVISDRGDSSTLAYQIFAKQAQGLEPEFWRMRKLVFGEREPNIYIILDVPARVARARSLSDGDHSSQFDVAPIDFYERVRDGFNAFAKALPDTVVVIDGNRPPEEVFKDFYRVINDARGR